MVLSYVRTEDGRVFRRTDEVGTDNWLSELIDGRWAKPSGSVFLGNLIEGEELSEEEVAKMVESDA